MYSTKIQPRQNAPRDFKSEKPYHLVPVIVEQVKDESGNVTHYLCEGGRLFVKEAYDRNFRVSHGLRMHGVQYNRKGRKSR